MKLLLVGILALFITWQDMSQIEDGYYLLRKAQNQASFVLIRTLPANTQCVIDTTTKRNMRYQYIVTPFKGQERNYSNATSQIRDLGRFNSAWCR